MSQISPIHISKLKVITRCPSRMDCVSVSTEQREFLEREAISIFTDMTNQGFSFQQSLAAIFVSGMVAAKESERGQHD